MFTTVGTRITDCCDHEHDSRDDAQKCLVEHQNEMRRGGRLSKRRVIEFESWDELEEEFEVY